VVACEVSYGTSPPGRRPWIAGAVGSRLASKGPTPGASSRPVLGTRRLGPLVRLRIRRSLGLLRSRRIGCQASRHSAGRLTLGDVASRSSPGCHSILPLRIWSVEGTHPSIGPLVECQGSWSCTGLGSYADPPSRPHLGRDDTGGNRPQYRIVVLLKCWQRIVGHVEMSWNTSNEHLGTDSLASV